MKEKLLKAFQARTTILRAIAFTFSLLFCIAVSAYDVEQDGLYYTLDIPNRTAFVESCSKSLAGSVTVPNKITFKTRDFTVDSIANAAFKDCKSITSVTIASGIRLGSEVFSGCTALTSATMPSDLKILPFSAFYGCANLSKVILFDGLTTIDAQAFYGCEKLEELSIPQTVKYLYFGCFENSGIKNIVLTDSINTLPSYIFRNSKLEHITLPRNLQTIREDAFGGSNLETITFPDKVTTINDYAFQDCKNLKEVIIDNACTEIGENVFSNCVSLKGIHLPDNLRSIGHYAFEGCTNITYMYIPQFVSSYTTDYLYLPNTIEEVEFALNNRTNLMGEYPYMKKLTIASNRNFDYIKAPKLDILKILKSTQSIGDGSYWSGAGSYWSKTQVVDSICVDDTSEVLSIITLDRFPSAKKLYLGRNVNASLDECFGEKLSSLTIGPLVTGLKMEKGDSLKLITSKITVPLQVKPSFSNSIYINVPLIVPKGTKAAYEQAPGWQNFFEIREEDGATGIENMRVDKGGATEKCRYNINGQKIAAPEKGINIIRYSDGSARKVIIK